MTADDAETGTSSATANASTTSPAADPAPPAGGGLCLTCGSSLVLYRRPSDGRTWWRCWPCEGRYARNLKRERIRARTHRALTRRLTAFRLLDEIHALSRSHGSREAFYGSLTDEQRTALAVRCLESADDALRTAEEEDRRHREANANLSDKTLQAELERMALDHLKQPGRGSIKRLGEVIRSRIAQLRRAGWKIEPPD